jgi:electron transport complex protein RnfG
MNRTLKYTLFLLIMGIVAGGLLALVNSFTAPIIEERQRQAVMEVLGEHFDYQDYSLDIASKYPDRDTAIMAIYLARNSESEEEFDAVIYQTSAKGYGGQIVSLIGIKADGSFDNVVVVEASGETKGLGTQVLDFDFGVNNESVNDYSYNSISGATVSSAAVHIGIDVAAAHFKRHVRRNN